MQSQDWNSLISQAAAGFDPVPDGEYDVECIECKAGRSSTDKTMFEAKFNIVSGPHTNRKVWNNFTVSPESANALGFFFKHMAALGLDRSFFQSNPAPEQIANAMVGKRARLKVGHREWGGTVRNDVKDVLPPTQETLNANPAAAVASPNGAAPTPGVPQPQQGMMPQQAQAAPVQMPQPQQNPMQPQPTTGQTLPPQQAAPQPAQQAHVPQPAADPNTAPPQAAPQPAPQQVAPQPVQQPQQQAAPAPAPAPAPQPQPQPQPQAQPDNAGAPQQPTPPF